MLHATDAPCSSPSLGLELGPLGCYDVPLIRSGSSDPLNRDIWRDHVNGTTKNHKSGNLLTPTDDPFPQHGWGLPLATEGNTYRTMNGWKEFLLRIGISSLVVHSQKRVWPRINEGRRGLHSEKGTSYFSLSLTSNSGRQVRAQNCVTLL